MKNLTSTPVGEIVAGPSSRNYSRIPALTVSTRTPRQPAEHVRRLELLAPMKRDSLSA
jgi:hypothetical protein